jgi:hypothetical protein
MTFRAENEKLSGNQFSLPHFAGAPVNCAIAIQSGKLEDFKQGVHELHFR